MNVKNEDKAFPTKKVEYSIIDLPPKTKKKKLPNVCYSCWIGTVKTIRLTTYGGRIFMKNIFHETPNHN